MYILDFKYIDDINPAFRKEILDFIYSPDFKYKNFVTIDKFKTIN